MTSDRSGRQQSPPDTTQSLGDLDGLRSRAAALRQTAALPQAEAAVLLEAALAELDGAIAALEDVSEQAGPGGEGRALSGLHSDRRLLHAVFTGTPLPLFVVDPDGTVLRANLAACELLGVASGYATGRPLAALVQPAVRAPLSSQLAAAARTGVVSHLRCDMLATAGAVPCELEIRPLVVRGDTDRLLVTVSPTSAAEPGPGSRHAVAAADGAGAGGEGAVVSAMRRFDLLAEAARQLLEARTVSESVLLQRAARLLGDKLAAWVVVDVNRRGELRRHYVAGPDDPASADLTLAVESVEPGPDSLPYQVYDSGQTLIIPHADNVALGREEDEPLLLARLGGASVLAVPMADGSRPRRASDRRRRDRTARAADDHSRFGVLTLIRRADDGQFSMADAALLEEIGALLGLAIASRRTLRQRTDAAEALRTSLLPPVLKPVPGVEMAYAHLAPTRGREVGGDFYDVYPTPGGCGVAIGDVCGTGEGAAELATAAARHAIRVLAHSTADPADVLRGANEIMLGEEFSNRFVTASAAHLSWRGPHLRVVLSSAGHPAPVLIRPDGRTEQVPGGGVALGILADAEPASIELELSNGDVLFCYTDGLTDARSPDKTYFKDILADNLSQLAGRRAADIVSEMQKVVLDFSDGVLLDDLTMLVMRVGAAPA